MSRPKKTPPPPPSAKPVRSPRKTSAKAAPGATVESVVARLLGLPQIEGETPALWRKTDFGGELSGAEKPFLDAALARLQGERRLVALSYGKSVYFAWADALAERLGPAPVEAAADDLMGVYRRLVRESGGFPDVKIAGLARGVGPAGARGLAGRLTALWRGGDVTLSLGDWSLASEETRAAAVELDGEKYLLVRFEGTSGGEPQCRADGPPAAC